MRNTACLSHKVDPVMSQFGHWRYPQILHGWRRVPPTALRWAKALPPECMCASAASKLIDDRPTDNGRLLGRGLRPDGPRAETHTSYVRSPLRALRRADVADANGSGSVILRPEFEPSKPRCVTRTREAAACSVIRADCERSPDETHTVAIRQVRFFFFYLYISSLFTHNVVETDRK